MKTISKETLAALREQYSKGTRVELVHMDDPYTRLTAGDKGTVRCVDDMGTIHINWDCGSSLGAVYGEDILFIQQPNLMASNPITSLCFSVPSIFIISPKEVSET